MAMKAEEVRIGNLLWNPYGKQPEAVYSIRPVQALNTNHEINEEHPDFFQPIPLTEEWLLKFGFKKSRLGYDLDEFSLYHNHSGALPIYGPYWKEWEAGYNIQYVHQLQNLYFAMTGRELNFKES